jgi:hypothetical protein
MRLSKLTIFIIFIILVSVFFMRQAYDYTKILFGVKAVKSFLEGGCILAVGILIGLFAAQRLPAINYVLFGFFLIIYSMFLYYYVVVPIERVHMVEYALLGYLVLRDNFKKPQLNRRFFLCLLILIIVGVVDEAIQWFLPYRVFKANH